MPQTLNIAVCEDEAAETVLLCDILNHSDIQNTYTVFTDADSFLASYEYGKYDLLLMDIYMKDSMTGIEAVSIIRETDADIPVAFITTSTEHALESYRLSAIGYIEKPVSAAELSNILHLAMLKKSDAPSLYVKRNKSMERLALSDIMYIEQRVSPVSTKPLNIGLDRLYKLQTLLGRVCIIKPEIELSVILLCQSIV